MSDTRPVLYVVGGGLSGISAAEVLSRGEGRPRRIVLLEARPRLGGRTSSYRESHDGQVHDTGQHLFMDAYVATRSLLKALGTENRLAFLDPLSLYMMDRKEKLSFLELPLHNGRLGLLSGILMFPGLSFLSRLSMLRIGRALPQRESSVDHMDARTFLRNNGQTDEAIQKFWELLIVSATNLPSDKVSASLLVSILKESLFSSGGPKTLGYNTVPLSELIGDPAQALLSGRGVDVRCRTPVSRFLVAQNRLTGMQIGKDTVMMGPEDHVIVAVPPWSFEALFPATEMNDPLIQNIVRLSRPSPILSVHLWFKDPVAVPMITGFSENEMHWVFNRDYMMGRALPAVLPDRKLADFSYSGPLGDFYPGRMLSCVVSGAEESLDSDDEDLIEKARKTVLRLSPGSPDKKPTFARVIRERFATPIFPPGQGMWRPPAQSFLDNLWIAGDMQDTGLPATMEGAVRSGFRAAVEVENRLERRSGEDRKYQVGKGVRFDRSE